MNPHDRVKRYAKLSAFAAVTVWGLLCFFVVISPRMGKLDRVETDLAAANKQLMDMRKEIENASIIGTPAPGQSRYEKFGILGADEEQLFLSDLIEFCKETGNTLNVVRRADVARPAVQKSAEEQQKSGRQGSAPAAGQSATPPPIIERVPHTVNFSGTFLSSFYLLRKLEAYKRLLTVERVELATDSRVGYPRLNGNVTIELYLVRNAGRPPSEGQAAAASEPATPTSREQLSPASRADLTSAQQGQSDRGV